MVSVPPYCGVPRLSHQFPVEVAVTAVVTAVVDVVDVVVCRLVVVVVVVVAAGVVEVVEVVEVVVVDFEEQDANTSDVTIRQVSTIQITPFFI